MNITTNHVYTGNVDRFPQWAGLTDTEKQSDELRDENLQKVVNIVRDLIKNYLQLDNVNFQLYTMIFTMWQQIYKRFEKI